MVCDIVTNLHPYSTDHDQPAPNLNCLSSVCAEDMTQPMNLTNKMISCRRGTARLRGALSADVLLNDALTNDTFSRAIKVSDL